MKEYWYFMDVGSDCMDLIISVGDNKRYAYKSLEGRIGGSGISTITFKGLKTAVRNHPYFYLAMRNKICDILWGVDWENGFYDN
jgi:hypothetical protein